ncbi:hypothetical protein FGE12_15715 [Aggregicoccus sp. 17bor-14]|uniref:hypothetical protein n=1 Tax=Myxococcaceae TaxID=31 RepID=UPI00129C4D14|nr:MULTISPECIES: hypothetical protein [Myxococcaceae]MBF5043847.1 hypothetical protein [Simulacricoccus sp. 17bor-14]MRI89599.1 hypothetical protein [Aggregicoccus sp. 17bor-14]
MRSSPLLFLVLPLLAACGDSDTIRLRTAGDDLLFDLPHASLAFAPNGITQLRVCGLSDPLPGGEDDETTLCALLDVNRAELEARSPGAVTLKLEGSAVVSNEVPGQSPSFEPGAGHAPQVRAAWVTEGCFGPPNPEPAVQQVRGELRIEAHDDNHWRGHLELHMEGQPGGSGCVVGAEGADFEVQFDAAYPLF